MCVCVCVCLCLCVCVCVCLSDCQMFLSVCSVCSGIILITRGYVIISADALETHIAVLKLLIYQKLEIKHCKVRNNN